MTTKTITAADVQGFTTDEWEQHFAADRIAWAKFSTSALSAVATIAGEGGDYDLARKARSALDRR